MALDISALLHHVNYRPSPVISVAPVDHTCAWLLVDLDGPDQPAIECSAAFVALTGYSRDWILGRNCRFLQHPTGIVPRAGAPRQYVDDDVVRLLRHAIHDRRESQFILINYRRGGQPFLNLLTVIPITASLVFGFALDVVEHPTAISHRASNGNYTVDYSSKPPRRNLTQRIDAALVHRLVASFGHDPAAPDSIGWEQQFLAESDDLVLIMARNGDLVYVGASAERILGWQGQQLLGYSISSICHPSDIMNLLREVAVTPTGGAIDISFRARGAHDGYTWLEAVGSAQEDPDSGDQSILLNCRPRIVLPLEMAQMQSEDGSELLDAWVKVSRYGIILYASASIHAIVGILPEDLVGKSIHSLAAADSPFDLSTTLDDAASYRRVKCPHMLVDRRNRRLRVNLDIMPGDVSPSRGPSYLILRMVRVRNERGDAYPQTTSTVYDPSGEARTSHLLGTTRATSWLVEREALVAENKQLAAEVQRMLAARRRDRRRRPPADSDHHACQFCGATKSPEWRRGPAGPRQLCNPCGIKWAKDQHRPAE